ncbi:MAG TPA: tetratricopeptide repeat protein [Deltaproteobacteria bacterium]|nr:tetratricopeptide repeat protein [Deltaproteobacteria bacterium]
METLMREGTPSDQGPLGQARLLLDEALQLVETDASADHVRAVLRLARRSFDSPRLEPGALIQTGHLLEEEGRFELAAEHYAEVVKLEPHAARGWTNLGEARRKLSQWQLALEAYNRALACEPDYLWALAGRAEALRMLGRLEDCIAPFEAALAKSPDHVFALQGLGAALSELGRYRLALPHWEHALRLRPSSGFASDGLARCHQALASTPDAG